MLSKRIQQIQASASIALSSLIADLRQQGKEVISLNVGELDFPTPKPILEATKLALDNGQTRYGHVEGIPSLREALARDAQKKGIDATKENIFVGNGSKHILYNIFQTLLDSGDEVIIPSPYWVTYPESVKLAGGSPIIVETKKDFQLDLDKIKQAISPLTKAIIINTPNNPTGAMYSQKSLEKLAKLALDKGFYIISDEAYEDLVFDKNQHISIASFNKEVFSKTITVKTFSKSYCMTGFRLGHSIAPAQITQGLSKLQSHLSGNPCSFAQFGALAALEMDHSVLVDIQQRLQKRRDLTYEMLSPVFDISAPQGAMYFFINIKDKLNNELTTCENFCRYVLEKTSVAILPGSAFGAPGFIRISFACDDKDLEKGLKRIREVLS